MKRWHWMVAYLVVAGGLALAARAQHVRTQAIAALCDPIRVTRDGACAAPDFEAPELERGRLGKGLTYRVVESAPLPNGKVGQLTVITRTVKTVARPPRRSHGK